MKSEETPVGDGLDQATVGTTRRQALAARWLDLRGRGRIGDPRARLGDCSDWSQSTSMAPDKRRQRAPLSHGRVSGGTVPELRPWDCRPMESGRYPGHRAAGGPDRQTLAHELATDATIWGYASALQYVQLYQQAVDKSSPSYTGFDTFLHQRNLADPSFSTFRTPNVDTLYSNAWLDLTQGPALIEIPAFGSRYYTLNFLDMYSNATNISLRTWGGTAGRFVIVPPGSPIGLHKVYRGYQVFRVATPYMWILMRILVENFTTDLATVHALQDRVKIRPTAPIGRGHSFPSLLPP